MVASKTPAKKTVAERKAPAHGWELSPETFVNRELSWLEFNQRVLHQAEDSRIPLLDRVNFLVIFTNNLDEFFMKRLGLLKRRLEMGMSHRRPDGMTVRQQIVAIREMVKELLDRQDRIFEKMLLPELKSHGIRISLVNDLNPEQRKAAGEYFRDEVFPVLTPLAVDPGHPFPFISNLSRSLGLMIEHPETGEKLFARVKIPVTLPQLIQVSSKKPGGPWVFIELIDLISHHLAMLFPGMVVKHTMPFRITRNADVERDEDEAEDLMDLIEEELKQRRFERVVRLEYGAGQPQKILRFLMQELEIDEEDVYQMPALLDYRALREITALPLPELRFRHWIPVTPKVLLDDEADLFSIIRKRDLVIDHPYESFTSTVERFIRAAAEDPHVLALKVTLYRTEVNSPFIPLLIRAAEAGKQVVVLVELKARFDEERNIRVAQALEKVGIHVVYGLVGFKTHTKTTLVVRREGAILRAYAHIGTGNYNAETARLYTDISLLTARPEITGELIELFNFLTGRSLKHNYKHLLVAPFTMRERFIAMIAREAAAAKAGKPSRIIAKMNSLEDEAVIYALIDAARAGVSIDLIVRGFCCLRPGTPKFTENIRVISVVGRFLEHSRIFHFAAGQAKPVDGEFYIGSADWMTRNLSYRVELITPVLDRQGKETLWEVLEAILMDQRQAWIMQNDGKYRLPTPKNTDPQARENLGTQQLLMARAKARGIQEFHFDPENGKKGKKGKTKGK
jgi:polyphosphate kinase